MKFKHPSGIRLALTSGHVTYVGIDWQSLPVLFHAEALARGCQSTHRPPPEPAEERVSDGPAIEPVVGGAQAKPVPSKKRESKPKAPSVTVSA